MRTRLQPALDAGDFPGAVDCCRERLNAVPEDADTHRHLAQVLAASCEPGLAMRHARRACELAPDDLRFADGWHNLGTALQKLGDRAGAFTALKNALMLDPTRAETYLNLGNLLIGADQLLARLRSQNASTAPHFSIATTRNSLDLPHWPLHQRGGSKLFASWYK